MANGQPHAPFGWHVPRLAGSGPQTGRGNLSAHVPGRQASAFDCASKTRTFSGPTGTGTRSRQHPRSFKATAARVARVTQVATCARTPWEPFAHVPVLQQPPRLCRLAPPLSGRHRDLGPGAQPLKYSRHHRHGSEHPSANITTCGQGDPALHFCHRSNLRSRP